MIRVDNAGTRRLSLITAQNGAQCVVGGSAYNTSTGTYTDLVPTLTTISSATTTSIDTAPASNCINDYDFINVKNTFAGSHTMTLQITSGSGGPFPLKTFVLLQDESMNYAHGTGFQFFDASGNLKETLVAATNWGVTGNLTVGGNTTLGDAAADSLTVNAGTATAPNIPSFLASSSGTQTDVTGDGTVVTVAFGTEIRDQANNFASNTFTANQTDPHDFFYSVTLSGITTHTQAILTLVTSNRNYTLFRGGASNNADGSGVLTLCGTVIGADMDSGDTAIVQALADGATKVVDISAVTSYFGGKLSIL